MHFVEREQLHILCYNKNYNILIFYCCSLFLLFHISLFAFNIDILAKSIILYWHLIGRLELSRSHSLFTIQHYGGRVTYNCESLLTEDGNSISDDLVTMFSRQSTQSTLLPKLFSRELKDIDSEYEYSHWEPLEVKVGGAVAYF